MTISTTKRKAGPYQGDSITTVFPFDFKIFEADDLRVIYGDESGAERDLILQAEYTVNMNVDQETLPGGSITLNTAPPTGTTLTMTSGMAYLQPTKLTNHGGFYPTVLNDSLDRLTILVQQLQEQVDRSLKVTVSSGDAPDVLISTIKNSESAARQSAENAQASQNAASESAQIAQDVEDRLELGLEDLAGVKEAIVPATAEEIQNGTAGKLVDAARLTDIGLLSNRMLNMQVFETSGVFTVPDHVTKVKVTVVGGGGGAGFTLINTYSGGGGSGGGTAVGILEVIPGDQIPVTVGEGGTPGYTHINGGTGGTSSFGSHVSATGGGGGIAGGTFSELPGVGVGGYINMNGGHGFDGVPAVSNAANAFAGYGGSSSMSGILRSVATGKNAIGIGQGGGAGRFMTENSNGGRGGNGIVIVEW